VLLTAHTEADALRAGLEGGAVDFIPKDAFADVVLLNTLQQLSILPPDA
jgi:CheY-like chemotaxis protein